MNFTPFRLEGWLFGNALLLCAAVSGAELDKNRQRAKDGDEATMPGVLNTELTRLQRPGSLRLTVRPHFGDFVNRDHFRLTLGARYGLTPQWEIGGDADAYVSHGFGDVDAGEKFGISRIQLGVKYRFADFLRPYWETIAGLKYSFPVGRPPPDLTDGLHHLTPYMTHAHRWRRRDGLTSFFSYGVDFVTRTDLAGTIEDGQIDADHWFVTPGVVWTRGAFVYSLEAALESTLGLESREEYQVTLRPGVKWTLPPKLTFNSRSRWVVGVSVSAGYGPDGSDFGASVRLQTNYDFKRFFRGGTREDAENLK